jgi:hypothetical protein
MFSENQAAGSLKGRWDTIQLCLTLFDEGILQEYVYMMPVDQFFVLFVLKVVVLFNLHALKHISSFRRHLDH